MRRHPTAGLGLALLSAVTFATSGTFARSLIEAGWTAEAAVAARVAVAAIVLAPAAVWSLRGKWGTLRRSLGTVGLFGLLAVAVAQAAFFNAVQYLPIGVALLLEYLGVILVVGWTWLVHGQRPPRLTVAGAAVAVVGLVFVLDLTGGADLDPVGVAWGLLAAVGLAGYFVLSARGDDGLPGVALASAGMAVGAAALVGLGAAGMWELHATFGTVEFAGHRMSWIVPLAGLSIVAAVVSYVAGIGAARILGARLSSFVGLTEVMFAVLIAWLVLGELPTGVQFAGGALIITGVVLVRIDEFRTPPATADEPPAVTEQQPVSTAAGS
ncbi:EamA family transporter [Dactylosporangium sp. NPDC005572]|uniref:EamA family transporter n=1 Tax=Dactylosporangium sp. NPDC005572 TaxID=3156889 RepID=UPI00339E55DD